jgi:tetratricopeptide (TPR) repeat protein
VHADLVQLVRETAPRLREKAGDAIESAAPEREELLASVTRARAEDRLEEALDGCRKLLERDSEDEAARKAMGEIEAVLLEREVDALVGMALAYAADGHLELATGIAEKVERLAPWSPRYLQLQVYLDEESARHRADDLVALARAHAAAGRRADADASVREALQVLPGHASAVRLVDELADAETSPGAAVPVAAAPMAAAAPSATNASPEPLSPAEPVPSESPGEAPLVVEPMPSEPEAALAAEPGPPTAAEAAAPAEEPLAPATASEPSQALAEAAPAKPDEPARPEPPPAPVEEPLSAATADAPAPPPEPVATVTEAAEPAPTPATLPPPAAIPPAPAEEPPAPVVTAPPSPKPEARAASAESRVSEAGTLSAAALQRFLEDDHDKALQLVERALALDPRNKKALELEKILKVLG